MIKLNKKYFNKKYVATLLVFVLIIFLIYYYINSQKYVNEHFTFSQRITTPLTPCKTRFIIKINNGNNVGVTISSFSFSPTKNDVEEKIIKQYTLNEGSETISDLVTSSTIGYVINIDNTANKKKDCDVTITPYCKDSDYTTSGTNCNTNFGIVGIKNFENNHRYHEPMSNTIVKNTDYTYLNTSYKAFNITVNKKQKGKACFIIKSLNNSEEEESNIESYTGYNSNTTYSTY